MLRLCIVVMLLSGISANAIKKHCDKFPAPGGIQDCCEMPQLIHQSSWASCNQTLQSNVDKSTEFTECPGDCLFRELDLLENETLDYEAIKKWLFAAVKEYKEWKPKMEETIIECAALVENANTTDLKSYPCNTKADFYLHCLLITTYLNCPAERWADSYCCNEIKEAIDSCPYPDVVPAPFRP